MRQIDFLILQIKANTPALHRQRPEEKVDLFPVLISTDLVDDVYLKLHFMAVNLGGYETRLLQVTDGTAQCGLPFALDGK